jgi:hypothetical protein
MAPPDGGLAADAGAPDGDLTPPPDAGPLGDGGSLYGTQPFSIVLMPDTQFYVQSYPEMFTSEARWIAEQKDAMGISFVLHLGDIVETPTLPGEWGRADQSMAMLDAAHIPYALCAGNHDIDTRTREGTLLNMTFPPSRFAPRLQGTFEPDKVENSYHLMEGGGRTWLVVALEFGPRDEVVTWADAIFKAHADKPAILLTHAYMYLGDQRYDNVRFPDPKQYWNPKNYVLPGTTNDGEDLWQKLVSKNDNVVFVFSGHATFNEGAAGLISTRRPNGHFLHEMLSNYQGCPSDFNCINRMTKKPVRGGEGMLRIVHVDPASRVAKVRTYSPFLMMSRMEPEHQFDLSLE